MKLQHFSSIPFHYIYTDMFVNSTFFKKEFDINKAELIGQGNFAQVYRVYDSEINDSLAIRKVTKNAAEGEDIAKEKIINEELKRVENQNILKIYDIIQSQHNIWYITQYCEGGSLWDALNDCLDNKMNEKDALQCVYQISRGVQQLHNHRITHRDLKPENILLKTRYIPGKPIPIIKIADFGLSTKKIIMETIAGTKQYIAPEQARFHNYTNAVDVWSLGIIFDQILHGTPFFVGDNNKQVFQKILKTPYKVRDPKIRESIKQFLLMILKKKPYERPIIAVICQNIQKILEEIESQSGQSTHLKTEQKRDMKKVKIHEQLSKKQQLGSNANLKNDRERQATRYERKVTGINHEENKSRTPIKKTSRAEDLHQIKNQQKKQEGVLGSRSKGKQEPEEIKKVQQVQESRNVRPSMIASQKLNVHKADRKKQQIHSHKQKFEQNIIDINQYIVSTAKTKEQIRQEQLLKISKQRQFMPSAHMAIGDMPQKIISDELLKDFKNQYDFLNMVTYDDEYESKLCKGKNYLKVNKGKIQKQLHQYKQKIKQEFLGQIDKYIDSYVDKTIE